MERNLNMNYGAPKKSNLRQNLEPLILPIVTAIGAFGGFPEPPNMFKRIIQNKIIQYLLLFLLIWQGGGGQNWKLSAKVTVVIFVLITIMNHFEKKDKNKKK
jgi:hypothetical protein